MLPEDDRNMYERFKCFNVYFRVLNEYMCICWCVTEINYKIHGATIKIITKVVIKQSLCVQ